MKLKTHFNKYRRRPIFLNEFFKIFKIKLIEFVHILTGGFFNSLEEIIIQMNEARFLNEQKELITGFKGSLFELSFRVNTIDRTFGIGILDEYRRGNTLHVTSGIYDIEVRMVNDYDTSKILTGTEMSLQVSVDSWNGIRKRLIVNSI